MMKMMMMGRVNLCVKLRLAQVVRCVLEVVIVAACLLWVSWWFVSPEDPADLRSIKHLDPWVAGARNPHSRADRGRREASILVFQAMPFVVVAILGFVVVELRAFIKTAKGHHEGGGGRAKWFSMKAYPILIGRPFSVLTLAELLTILGVLLLVLYHFGRLNHIAFARINANLTTYRRAKAASQPWEKLHYAARYSGTIAILPFSLLWIPVSRGSPFLRLVGVSFERAVRYHMWLATLMMVFLSFHGVGYILYYVRTKQADEIYGWETGGNMVAVLAGLVALIIGLVIWAMSAEYFRRRFYDLSFIIHHLYIPFLLFWLYHVIWTYHFFVIPVLLFLVDRLIRMVQSRRRVDVVCARLHKSGAVQLMLPIEPGLFYNALSKWCIGILGLSRLQWHFFSTFSTPLDEKRVVSFIIKPRGGWTNTLCNQFHVPDELQYEPDTQNSCHACPFSFKARVEGPYSDESDFYLKYKRLVLVAGGIGISPLLAIVQDILYRYRALKPNTKHLPKSIIIYHCVRKPDELCILSSINPHQILPDYEAYGLSIEVHAYITSKNMNDYSGIESREVLDMVELWKLPKLYPALVYWPRMFYPPSKIEPRGISSISTRGKTRWVASVTIASIVGYFVLSGLTNTYMIKSHNHDISNYNRAHLVVAYIFLGTTIFGGFIVLMWFMSILCSKKNMLPLQESIRLDIGKNMEMHEKLDHVDDEACGRPVEEMSFWAGDLHFHTRPNWREVFNGFTNSYGGECIGVLVFGSKSIQEDIARECRRNSCLSIVAYCSGKGDVFHYHSFTPQF